MDEHEKILEWLQGAIQFRAHALYGNPVPEAIAKRVKQEYEFFELFDTVDLVSYYTIYEASGRLAYRNNFLGQKNRVGASLIGYLLGVSPINPLPAHYRCPSCKHFEFYTSAENACWPDIQEKICPHCAANMTRDGYGIDLTMFFGFPTDPHATWLQLPSYQPDTTSREKLYAEVMSDPIFEEDDILEATENATGIRQSDIPLDEKDVFGLFSSSSLLGITEDDPILGGFSLAGLPEFRDARLRQSILHFEIPDFASLIRLAGFVKEEGPWHDSFRSLLEKVSDPKEIVSTQDGIYDYLISKGFTPHMALKIARAITARKVIRSRCFPGDGERQMKERGVPEWWIKAARDSGNVWNKAIIITHAETWARFLWFKLHKPQEFYTAYFAHQSAKGIPVDDILTKTPAELSEQIKGLRNDVNANSMDLRLLDVLEVTYERAIRGLTA